MTFFCYVSSAKEFHVSPSLLCPCNECAFVDFFKVYKFNKFQDDKKITATNANTNNNNNNNNNNNKQLINSTKGSWCY